MQSVHHNSSLFTRPKYEPFKSTHKATEYFKNLDHLVFYEIEDWCPNNYIVWGTANNYKRQGKIIKSYIITSRLVVSSSTIDIFYQIALFTKIGTKF